MTISDSESNFSSDEPGESNPRSDASSQKSRVTRARSTEGGTPLVSDELPNPRPALTKLQQDQEEVKEDLQSGFGSVADVVRWSVKTNIRTLGALEPEFYSDRISTPLELQWLTGRRYSNQELDEEKASGFRADLADRVDEASDWAYRFFRDTVTEYTDEKTPQVEMSGGAVAFRPALTELEQKQITALLTARTGFEGRAALSAWERKMQDAAFGEYGELQCYPMSRSPESWGNRVMLKNVGETTPARDIFLMESVFPACVSGVRHLRRQADEDVDDGTSDNETLSA